MSRSLALWRMLPIVIACWLMSTSGCGDVAGPTRRSLGDSLGAASARYSWWSRNRVATVTVTLTPDTVRVGHQATARAVALNARGDTVSYRYITWTSSDSTVARVSQTGVVTGVLPDTVHILASINRVTASVAAVVVQDTSSSAVAVAPVASVIVLLPASSLSVGSTMQPAAVLKDAQGNTLSSRLVSWSSSNSSIASVNASTGLITAVAVGTASITATSEGVSGAVNLTVQTGQASVAKVSVALASSSIYVGGTTTATATPTDSSGQVLTGLTTSWTSSNSAVARVDAASGAVTGVSAGSANIVASSGGVSGSAPVTVQQAPVATVAVSLANSTLLSGSSTQATAVLKDSSGQLITNQAVQWSTSNTGVATVNASTGLVQAIAAGTAAIVATSQGKIGQAILTVTAPAPVPVPVPSKLAIMAQPSASATSGSPLGRQPVIQLQDATSAAVSQSGVVVTAAIASGGGTLSGMTTATTNATGVATFSNLTITGSGAQTLVFTAPNLTSVTSGTITVSASTGFAIPNILNNGSFETGWNGFTDWSFSATPIGIARATDYASNGQYSLRLAWTPNPGGDAGGKMAYTVGSADHIWVRFYVRLTQPITTIMKFARFYNGSFGQNLGGLFLGSGSFIFSAGWDAEDASIVTPIGLSQAQVIDGNWHSMEIEYWRNGDPSGYPSMAFWWDGASLSLPDGTPVHSACGSGSGSQCNNSYWSGGRLYAGERVYSGQINIMEWLGTLNAGNTTTGQVNIDNVAISTVGRIGP